MQVEEYDQTSAGHFYDANGTGQWQTDGNYNLQQSVMDSSEPYAYGATYAMYPQGELSVITLPRDNLILTCAAIPW